MFCWDSRIRYSECDAQCRLTLGGMLDYFQDTSTFQTEDLGVGIEYLKPRNLVWVLASWQIEISRYPVLGEEIQVATVPYDFKGFLGYRNFLMRTKEGEVLAKANTLWTLLHFDTMKPALPPDEMLEKYPVEPRIEMNYAGRKIPLQKEGVTKEPIIVRRQHLDSNHHVNNSQYVSLAANYLPEGFMVGQLRTEYKRQAHLDDVMIPYIVNENNRIVVSLRDQEGQVYMNAEFTAM